MDAGNLRAPRSVAADKMLKMCIFVQGGEVNIFLQKSHSIHQAQLNDGEQTMLKLFSFVYVKQTSYLMKNSEFPFKEIIRTI